MMNPDVTITGTGDHTSQPSYDGGDFWFSSSSVALDNVKSNQELILASVCLNPVFDEQFIRDHNIKLH